MPGFANFFSQMSLPGYISSMKYLRYDATGDEHCTRTGTLNIASTRYYCTAQVQVTTVQKNRVHERRSETEFAGHVVHFSQSAVTRMIHRWIAELGGFATRLRSAQGPRPSCLAGLVGQPSCDAGPRSLAMQPSERFPPNAMFCDSHALTRLEVSGRSSTRTGILDYEIINSMTMKIE
eukprot:COSAG02_NODE_786_length_17199_cov_25.278889_13_plen_178_part_00